MLWADVFLSAFVHPSPVRQVFLECKTVYDDPYCAAKNHAFMTIQKESVLQLIDFWHQAGVCFFRGIFSKFMV
jgi:hypothetical protein